MDAGEARTSKETPGELYARRLSELNQAQDAENRSERLLGFSKLAAAALTVVAAVVFLHYPSVLEFLLLPVAAFLILEPRFPRSVRYCTASARDRLAAICAGDDLPGSRALARLAALERWLVDLSPETLHGGRVHEVLTYVVDEAHAACDAVMSELLGRGAREQGGRESTQPQSQSQTQMQK